VGKVAEISAAGAEWAWIVGPHSTPAPDALETLNAELRRARRGKIPLSLVMFKGSR